MVAGRASVAVAAGGIDRGVAAAQIDRTSICSTRIFIVTVDRMARAASATRAERLAAARVAVVARRTIGSGRYDTTL
jgi:hypothetical protein